MTTVSSHRRRVGRAFGAVLHAIRREKRISQEQLAALGGFDRTYPSLLERGLRTPTIVVLFRLSDALSVEPQFLITKTLELLHPD